VTVPHDEEGFERLLTFLRDERGFDFTGYKRASLIRRVTKRMQTVGVEGFGEYQDYLEVHPTEFAALFDTMLINVTEFFRDRQAWNALRSDHIPMMLAERGPDSSIRAWSAACASGEEAYSLAIALAEALGVEAFKDRVKIYATDVDEHALAQARAASYPEKSLVDLPEELRDRYFERNGERFVFRHDLRRYVVFGKHDLLTDAPISHLDLLSCRNALMYFNSEAQARILARFHFALRDGGLLFLGRAEMLRSYGNLFVPLDLKARIFGKGIGATARDRLAVIAAADRPDPTAPVVRRARIREVALDAYPGMHLVADLAGVLVHVSGQAKRIFGLTDSDIGRRLQDLRISYLPVELRSRIDETYAERRTVYIGGVTARLPDEQTYTLDLQITPLLDDGNELLGVSICFIDVSRQHRLQIDLEQAHHELETAYEELQSTNEELETTNEELQSTIEELETTNEELQSTNEELETMNEELQSTNEELQTMNSELHLTNREMEEIQSYMDSLLSSMRIGVAVVDRDLSIKVWSRKSENLWGIREDEVIGQALLEQDIGLPVAPLAEAIHACLAGSQREEMVLEAVNRRGKTIQCHVTCTPLMRGRGEVGAVVVLMEEWQSPGDASPPRPAG
jgi:two-component system, chemotaxis family, CheB/CheR fusion protein